MEASFAGAACFQRKLLGTHDVILDPDRPFKMPTVSVIVINFNYAAYIESALHSVIKQTYPDIEILVVDDNSTDESWNVISDLARANRFTAVKTFRLERNLGQTGAAAYGFERSCGQYIILLDADDLLMPRCVETHVYAHMSSRLAVGFSSVDALLMIGDAILAGRGSKYGAEFIASGKGRLTDMVRPIDVASEDLWFSGRPAPIQPADIHFVMPPQCETWVWSTLSGHCFRREALQLFLKRPLEGLRSGLDGFLVRPVTALCGSMLIDKPLMAYRIHGKNLFAVRAPLMNLRLYAPGQIPTMVEVQKRAIIQMIEDADIFCSICESPFSFFEAIERQCNAWPLGSEHGEADFMQRLLDLHKERLANVFGDETLNHWLRRAQTEAVR